MNLNKKQKIVVIVGMALILVTFLIPPTYVLIPPDYAENSGEKMWHGYKPFAIFRRENDWNNLMFIHSSAFFAQLTVIIILTIGSVFILQSNN